MWQNGQHSHSSYSLTVKHFIQHINNLVLPQSHSYRSGRGSHARFYLHIRSNNNSLTWLYQLRVPITKVCFWDLVTNYFVYCISLLLCKIRIVFWVETIYVPDRVTTYSFLLLIVVEKCKAKISRQNLSRQFGLYSNFFSKSDGFDKIRIQ